MHACLFVSTGLQGNICYIFLADFHVYVPEGETMQKGIIVGFVSGVMNNVFVL